MMSHNAFVIVLASTLVMIGFNCSVMAGSVQDAIDHANPGEIVSIPSGIYQEAIRIKDGVILVGAGAESTVLDGGGSECVVAAGKNSMMAGFTIQNGRIGLHNNGNFVGIFECVFKDYTRAGVSIHRGSAAISHNKFIGDGERGTGVISTAADPYLGYNVIKRNRVGIRTAFHYAPVVANNLFIDNTIAVMMDGDTEVVLEKNIYDGNKETTRGPRPLGGTDIERSVHPEEENLDISGSLQGYLALMDRVGESALQRHPCVVYDLATEKIGRFGVTILNHWATFSVSASTVDTDILGFDAVDQVTDQDLKANYFEGHDGRPGVAVKNPELTVKEHDRFVLDKIYDHLESYYPLENGDLVFNRLTTMDCIEIILPQGYRPAFVNHAYTESERDGNTIVEIRDMGYTRIEVRMESVAGN